MSVDDPTGRPHALATSAIPFDFTIIHRPGRSHQVPYDVSILQRDTELAFLTDDN